MKRKRSIANSAERKLDGAFVRFRIYQLAFIEGDRAEMEKQVDWSRGSPYNEGALEAFEMWTAAYSRPTRRVPAPCARLRGPRDTRRHRGNRRSVAGRRSNGAKPKWANAHSLCAMRKPPRAAAGSWHPRIFALVVFSRLGDTAHAKAVEESLRKDLPLDTLVNSYWIPAAHAAAAVHRGDAQAAIEALQPASTLEFADPEWSGMYVPYIRGQALLLAKQPQAAATEFQKLIDHPGAVINCPTGALARLGIARSYAQAGEREKSRAAYEDLFKFWKNADPDFPLLLQAKSEYARLK